MKMLVENGIDERKIASSVTSSIVENKSDARKSIVENRSDARKSIVENKRSIVENRRDSRKSVSSGTKSISSATGGKASRATKGHAGAVAGT